MRLDFSLLDTLTAQAKANPRLRQTYDLHTTHKDNFQRFDHSSTGSPQVLGFSVELGRWHNAKCMESGSVILECKDGKYEPLGEEDIMNL